MKEDNRNESVTENLSLDKNPCRETDSNCPLAHPSTDPLPNKSDLGLSQMVKELPDGSQVTLHAGKKGTATQRDKLKRHCQCNTGLKSKNEKQSRVPKKKLFLERHILALKALSDKAWENEKRKPMAAREHNDNPTSPAVRKPTKCFLRWRRALKNNFQAGPWANEHRCKKCGMIFLFPEERNRLSASGLECLVCRKDSSEPVPKGETGSDGSVAQQLPPFVCEVCWRLKKHLRGHGIEDAYACTKCKLLFRNPSFYRSHVKNRIARPYQCSLCREYFMKRRHVGNHMRDHIRDGSYFGKRPSVERVRFCWYAV